MLPAHVGGNREVYKAVKRLLQVKASQATLRGKHLNLVPWCFVRARSVEGALDCWTQVMSRPLEDHDPLVREFMSRLGADLDVRRQGGELSEALDAEVTLYEWLPLCEDVGESYHRGTNVEQTRAAASTMAHLKQDVRREQEQARLKKWVQLYGDG